MAIHIQQVKNNVLCVVKESAIHSVPLKMHADCDAKVSDYFEPSVKETGGNSLEASFRGFPLKGSKIELPQGYVGVVFHESIAPICDKEERKFHIINNFKSLTYWNWDKAPSKNDKIVQALEWIEIAEALHSPVEEE